MTCYPVFMFCPSCSQPLVVLEFENIELDHCLSCGGVWLDAGELELILRGAAGAGDDGLVRGGERGARRCPMCRVKMSAAKLARSGVEVDYCPRQHGLWLDKGELEQILAVEAGDARIRKLRDFCARVFPSGPAGNPA